MTGESRHAPEGMKRLLAVTVCINYADYLECIIPNNRHFDRWLIATVASDQATQSVCERYGIEFFVSRVLRADGRDFDAVTNKGRIINEAIDCLLQSESSDGAWCVICDADILLPRDFGQRVRAMPIEAGRLYSTAGRKICETRDQFESMVRCEPWLRFPSLNIHALGYLNLFSLAASPNRYPSRVGYSEDEHDDVLFTRSFALECRGTLPFVVLHLGSMEVNWHGRISDSFTKQDLKGGSDATSECVSSNSIETLSTAVVISPFPNGTVRDFGRRYSRLILVDDCQIRARSLDALEEADRVFLRSKLDEELKLARSFEWLSVHTAEAVSVIPNESIDHLHLCGEVSSDALHLILLHWLPKLCIGATISGDAYGLPAFPDATYSIAILLGAPDNVSVDGRWEKLIKHNSAMLRRQVENPAEADGIVIVSGLNGPSETLLISLYSVVKYWAGPVEVWYGGQEDVSVQLYCRKLGVDMVPMLHADSAEKWRMEDLILNVPYRRTILLSPGDLLIASPKFTSESRGRSSLGPLFVTRDLEGFRVEPAICVAGNEFDGSPQTEILVCGDQPQMLSDAAWEVWCEIECEATEANVSEIRVASDVTIVTFVRGEDAGDFQRNWLTWRFRSTPVVIFIADTIVEDFWIQEMEGTRIVRVSEALMRNVMSMVDLILSDCETKRILLVPPLVAALPGAELWPDLPVDWSAIHFPEYAGRTSDITGNRFIPKMCFALLRREEWADLRSAQVDELFDIPSSIIMWAAEQKARGSKMLLSDLHTKGWKIPPEWRWHNIPSNAQGTSKAFLRRNAVGKLMLADDVVVINLPERGDRRKRVRKMMAAENLAFRFVDGIRVEMDGIVAHEISEVGRQNFKTVAGFDKYLRGMVGCRRAHLRELENAKAMGRSSILIMEDDVCFSENWLSYLEQAYSELPEGWLQLYLSASDFRASQPVSRHLRRLLGAYQTTAILYSARGIEAALNCLQQSRSEIDHWMGMHLHPYGNSYVIEPQLTFQKGGISSIMGFDRGVTR